MLNEGKAGKISKRGKKGVRCENCKCIRYSPCYCKRKKK